MEKLGPPSLGRKNAKLGLGQTQGRTDIQGLVSRAVSWVWVRSRLVLGSWAVLPNRDISNEDLRPELDTKKDCISLPSVIACDLINPLISVGHVYLIPVSWLVAGLSSTVPK